MRPSATTGLLSITLVIAPSTCSSGSDSPESIDDIRDSIEAAGYECDNPAIDNNDPEGFSCDEDIFAVWYQSAADEVDAFDAVNSVAAEVSEDVPVSLYVIRGDHWRISGDEAAVTQSC